MTIVAAVVITGLGTEIVTPGLKIIVSVAVVGVGISTFVSTSAVVGLGTATGAIRVIVFLIIVPFGVRIVLSVLASISVVAISFVISLALIIVRSGRVIEPVWPRETLFIISLATSVISHDINVLKLNNSYSAAWGTKIMP